jgi:multiple sugar transport system ATP-binding protein
VNDVAPKDRDIAMVFQSYALYPHMSVYDNMAFGLKLRKVPKAEIDTRVKEAARILGLENLQKKPRELSGGQRQRVALGRAIVREPAVFLMDEPLSNLDAKLRVQTRAEIARLHQRLGTTTVYVTHDQVEAMTMGTRIAVMDKGELQQVGAPQDLYDNPRKLFVAGFIGSPAMNFVNVDRDGDAVKGDGVSLPIPTRYRGGLDGTSKLVAGFRPEHLELGDLPNSATIRAKADVVEFLGDEELLHVTVPGHEGDVVAVVGSEHRVKPGDVLDLKLPLEKLHLFDQTTGDALAWSAASTAEAVA